MSLRDWLQSFNLSESSESSQGLSSSVRCSAPTTSAARRPMSKRKSADANNLRVDDPKQVRLRAYSVSMFGAKKKCFNAAWYQKWNWLEHFVKFEAAFCFRRRNFESKGGGDFRGMRCESTFTTVGHRNWKHATKMNRGFSKHAASKEHLACNSTWKEKIKLSGMATEITSLVNTEATERNCYYFSTIIDIVAFFATRQLAFRLPIDAFEN